MYSFELATLIADEGQKMYTLFNGTELKQFLHLIQQSSLANLTEASDPFGLEQ